MARYCAAEVAWKGSSPGMTNVGIRNFCSSSGSAPGAVSRSYKVMVVVGMVSPLCFYACLFLKNRSPLNGYEHRLAHYSDPCEPCDGGPRRHRRGCAGVGGLARCPR